MVKLKRINFTPEFKAVAVIEALTGDSSQYADRLIRPLKEEEVYLNDYKDIHEARSRIGHFIDQCITRNVHTLR